MLDLDLICQNELALENIKNEIALQQTLSQCDGVLKLREIYIDYTLAYLVLDFQEEGSLLNKILDETKFSEQETKLIMT